MYAQKQEHAQVARRSRRRAPTHRLRPATTMSFWSGDVRAHTATLRARAETSASRDASSRDAAQSCANAGPVTQSAFPASASSRTWREASASSATLARCSLLTQRGAAPPSPATRRSSGVFFSRAPAREPAADFGGLGTIPTRRATAHAVSALSPVIITTRCADCWSRLITFAESFLRGHSEMRNPANVALLGASASSRPICWTSPAETPSRSR